MLEPMMEARRRVCYRLAARGLTLARLASVPLFCWLLVSTSHGSSPLWRTSLGLFYVGIALSDVFDGRLARRAGAASYGWGRMDAAADIAFTSLSLAAAAWLGYVGPWVPAGVALLGGRFLLRNLGRAPAPTGRLREDRAGKAAGVIYYLLVGVVVLALAVLGPQWHWYVARLGDIVFLYTLYLLLRRQPAPINRAAL